MDGPHAFRARRPRHPDQWMTDDGQQRGVLDHARPRSTREGDRVPLIDATISSVARVRATSCTLKTLAPAIAATAVAASVPSTLSWSSAPRVSPTKSLLDNAMSTGQPVTTNSSTRRSSSSPCQVLLTKSCVGSIRMLFFGTPLRTTNSAISVVCRMTSATRPGSAPGAGAYAARGHRCANRLNRPRNARRRQRVQGRRRPRCR